MLRGLIAGVLLFATIGGADAHTPRHSADVYHSAYGWSYGTKLDRRPTTAHAHYRRSAHLHRRRIHSGHTYVPVLASSSGDLATVPTTAGISITVAKKLVPQFQGFVADLVKLGYTPRHINCWAPVGTHVANSNHYHGGACDFDQTGWNRTQSPMYHVTDLATKWGLRDGCSFRRPDCGHIDDGTNIGWKHPNSLLARYIDFQTTPVRRTSPSNGQTPPLENFEE